jgi:hypothetical protein
MILTAAKAVPIERELERRGHRLKRAGRELVGPCPVCGGRDRFAVHTKKRVWNCRGCGRGGDVIDLVKHLDRTTTAEAVRTLTGSTSNRPTRTPTAPKDSGDDFGLDDDFAPTPPAPKSDDDYERRQREKARWLWSQRQPIAGTIAERYLREARGYSGALPPTLAFLPARNGKPPTMISAFAYPNEIEPGTLGEPANVEAVHLTALKPDGSGKADVTPNKIMIASPAGNPIAVAAMSDSMWGLAITEGIEDALSIHAATGLGAWATGSASHMPKLATAIVRAEPECVHVFADGDVAGQRHAHELAAELKTLTARLELDIEIRLRRARP